MLEVNNIYCGYGDTDIVKGVSFEVKKGEILCITGANGCGKTTLLRAIAGVLPYKSGYIKIDDVYISGLKPRELAKKTAMLSQTGTGGDYFDFTVFDTVMLGRYAHKKSRISDGIMPIDVDIVNSSMESVGIADLRDRLITELSGGQLQRVFLARAFCAEPSVILLDEPANHLDLKNQIVLAELLHEWVRHDRAVVGVFHDLNIAMSIADNILIMKDGKKELYDTAKNVSHSDKLENIYGFDVREHMRGMLMKWE